MKIQTQKNTIEIPTSEVIAALAVGAISIWATSSIFNNVIKAATFNKSSKIKKYSQWKKGKGSKEQKQSI